MRKPNLDKKEKGYILGKFTKNKQNNKWLSLEMSVPSEKEGDKLVVKGISKRVIVVKSPDPKIFEQAIFIVREDYAGQSGMKDKDVYNEATRAAARYLGGKHSRAGRAMVSLRAPLYAAAGAVATGLAWIAVQFSHL